VFELTPAEWQYNPIGSVHGGVLTTLRLRMMSLRAVVARRETPGGP